MGIFTIAICISLHVAKIADVTDDIIRAGMCEAIRVVVGTSCDTSI